MGYEDKNQPIKDEVDLVRLDRNRIKNRAYFDDFLNMHLGTLANEKYWQEDEILVQWCGTFVTIHLCGYDAVSMVVETGSDWPKFKTDLEMGYENMLLLRFKAHQKCKTDKNKARYLERKRAIFEGVPKIKPINQTESEAA